MTEERAVRGERVHRYEAPPDLLFGALSGSDGFLNWLPQAPGELLPVVLEAVPSRHIVWASLWPVSPTDTIEFDLEPFLAGTSLRFRWWTAQPPDDRGIAITRQRLNRYLGSDLRGWVSNWNR
jgi:hypothetical protein